MNTPTQNNYSTRKDRLLARLEELDGQGTQNSLKRSLGQNFLISDNVIEKIMFAARTESFSEVIEVGPGLGALTEDIVKFGKPVTIIELDRRFAEYWRQRALANGGSNEFSHFRVMEIDALQLNWSELNLPEGTLFISNLPYQISSSLVIERSLDPAGISRMILMFQKEVAQRIGARAATKEYGLLTVIAQAFWETQNVCDAGPRDFFPPPNVASRVVQFRRRSRDWLTGETTAVGFLRLVKAAFSHRRKLLLRNLEGSYFNGQRTVVPALEKIFRTCGLEPKNARAEELDAELFVQLYLELEKEGLKPHGS